MSADQREKVHPPDSEPPRWRQLCSALQQEQDLAKFQLLLEEINRVLSEHEKKSNN